jgi:endonuclease YncB( thermonuclease family)
VTTIPSSKILAGITVLLCFPVLACAATLQAKVVQVESGNTLVVSNINRSLRIRLKAVAPPESGQAFSDAARDHLKALVFDKAVFVEYTHLANGYLEAKVLLNGIDIGSQMLRDGVAWYDIASSYELSESDRALYAQCEQAARSERRGLWEDPTAIAPWEFRQAQQAKQSGSNPSLSFQQYQTRKARSSQSFSNTDLMGGAGGMFGSRAISGQPTFKPISANGTAGRWTRYESVPGHFSVLFPSDGVESASSVVDPEGHAHQMLFLGASNKVARLLLLSGTEPNGKHTDASAAEEIVRGYLSSMNHDLELAGVGDRATATPDRDLKLNGYGGKQYRLSSPAASGVMRVFSKQVGDQREIIVLLVLTRPGGESDRDQFLNSLKINQ